MLESYTFSGKFSFSAPDGMTFTLDSEGTVSLAAPVDKDPLQRFNSYGATEIWLQGPNGSYLAYDKTRPAYAATQERGGTPAVFRIEDAAPDVRIVQVEADGTEYYVNANGSALDRIAKTGTPPDTTRFTRTQITPGLDKITPGSLAAGFDLSFAYLVKADLSGIRFQNANLSFADIQGADITGAIFSAADCTGIFARGCLFDNVTFSGVTANEADMQGVRILPSSTFSGTSFDDANLVNLQCDALVSFNGIFARGADFGGADLRQVAMNNAKLGKAKFVGVDFRGAQVSSSDFKEAVLNRCKFSEARVQFSTFDAAVLVGIDFTGSEMNNSTFIGANLTNAKLEGAVTLHQVDFSAAQLIGAQLRDVDFVAFEIVIDKDTNFTQAAMDGVNLTSYTLDNCVFLYASLRSATLDKASFIDTTLTQADLSFATITGNVKFYGANLSNAKLEGAKLNGGQFGPLKPAGTLASDEVTNAATCDAGFARFLNTGPGNLQVQARAGNRSWSITHGTREYVAYLEGDDVAVHEVSSELSGAVLSNAFMPNAILKEANLYAVDMTGAQWYGGSADASGANMELVNLTNSNVATMDFTQAKLYGANFSFSNLVQTNFYKAELTSTTGKKPVSLAFASLQGTNFEEASIYDANLTNAAISLLLEDTGVVMNGEPLFDLDPSFGQYLDTGFLTPELVLLFAGQNITVTEADTLAVLSLGAVWVLAPSAGNDFGQYILVLPKGGENITVLGHSPSGTTAVTVPDFMAVPLANLPLDIEPDLDTGVITPALRSAFVDVGYPLIDTAGFVVLKSGERWAFRNMYLDKTLVQSGYGQFEVYRATSEEGGEIKLYGAAPLVVMRTSSGNVSERVPVQFGLTTLAPVNMNKATITPSGLKFGLLGPQLPYEYLMSPGLPPSPPSCVPSPTSWCP